MIEDKIVLFFPQWQGSGNTKELYNSAVVIKNELLKNMDLIEILISKDDKLKLEHGILGYRQILDQLNDTKNVIRSIKPKRILSIGGDCGIEVAPVSYLNRLYDGDLTVIWLDAHGDLNTPQSSQSKKFHGMPLRALLGEGDSAVLKECFSVLKPNQVIMAGVRDLDIPEEEFIKENKIEVITVEQLSMENENIIDVVKSKGKLNVYIHLDLDVLDPVCFPNCMCPSQKGLDIESIINLIHKIKQGFNIVGISVLEYVHKNSELVNEVKRILNFCYESL